MDEDDKAGEKWALSSLIRQWEGPTWPDLERVHRFSLRFLFKRERKKKGTKKYIVIIFSHTNELPFLHCINDRKLALQLFFFRTLGHRRHLQDPGGHQDHALWR
jgi:hypothetical protein